jgi:RNA-dependent RNA polymerase
MMFGVIDEHGILEEGQVLVGNGSVTGPVLISRSPCLMPGDIQKAQAVAQQERFAETYSRMTNVIVFSAKGQRPLADKLGGGDLDGDQVRPGNVCSHF